MKRSLKRRGSVRNRPPPDDNGTPMSLQSSLFGHNCQSISESIVVPETPNNSFKCKASDMSITSGTVLETPDTPASEIADTPENSIYKPLNKNDPDESFENLFAKSITGKVPEKNLMSSDEEGYSQDITRKLNLRSMNVMSILESDNSLSQSLSGQNQNDSSRVNVDKQYFRCISPVKGQKRRSLAEVILPFDLNDNEGLSRKLKSIKEIEQSKRKIKQTRSSLSCAKTKATKSRQSPLVKSRVSLQFSDLKIKDASIPKCSDPQVKNTDLKVKDKSIPKYSDPQVTNTSSCLGETKSKNSSTFFSENEDLDVTALSSVNESIISIINGLQSENIGEEADDKESFPSKPLLHAESTSPIPQQLQVKQTPPQMSSRVGELCEPEELNRSEEFCPTQAASTLILEGVVAFVEVRVQRANHSDVIKDQLIALGAAVREKLTSDVTHVVFRDGTKGTFNRAKKRGIHLVSSLWVDACKETFQRAPEALYPSTSLESYSNPVFLSRLRKQKSMQPRDLGEEERIADIKARRRKKVFKAALSSPPLEENHGFCTPKRKSPDFKEDVNSPLFGIGHLLTPKQQMVALHCSDIETSTAESDLDASYSTPLSRRLYKRFVIGQESLVNESETNINTNCNKRNEVSKSSTPPGSTIDNSCLDRTSTSQNHVKDKDRRNNRNVSGVFELHLSSETSSELETGDEHTDILGRHHLLDQRPRSRRSQRLVLKSNTTNERENQFQVYTPSPENDKGKDRNGEDGNTNKERDGIRSGKEQRKVTDDSGSHLSNGLNSQGHSRRIYDIHNSKEMAFKGKQKSCPGRANETFSNEKSDLGSCSTVQSLDNYKECNHGEERRNLGTDKVGSMSNSLHIAISKKRGRKLLSLECLEPSQELIIPSTPSSSQVASSGPYSVLHVKKKKTHRTALRELVGSGRTTSQGKKRSISKRGKPSALLSQNCSTSGSSGSDNSVFPSSDKDQLSFKILPLPNSRDSIEDFVTPIKSFGRMQRSSQKNSILYLTSFHSRERKCVVQIIKKLGRFTIANEVDKNTSHVVCGEERRTVNLLFGIAHGSWILDKSWIYESLDMGKWAPEEPFEMFSYCPAAKICREQRLAQRESYRQMLFSGVGSVCVLDDCKPPSDQLKTLLSLCGCNVVSSVRNANLVVCNPTINSRLRNQITHVSELWVLDSVQHHKVQNVDNYKIVDDTMETEQLESERTSL